MRLSEIWSPKFAPTFVMASDRQSIISLDGRTQFRKRKDCPDRFFMSVFAEGRFLVRGELVNLGPNLIGALVGWEGDCDLWGARERQEYLNRLDLAADELCR